MTLTNLASLLLTVNDREAALGDLQEANENALQCVRQIFGFALRRQLELWKNWRPWIAAFGAMPCSFGLMGISVSISWNTLHFLRPAIFLGPNPAVRHGLLPFICQVLLLFACAWTSGFVVGSISRRTIWASAILCASPALFCLSRFGIVSLSRFCLLLFLLPAVLGAWHGLRQARMSQSWAISIALIITLAMICLWTTNRVLLLDLFLAWPAWYLAIASPPTTEIQ